MADENNSNEDGQFVPDGSMEPLSPQEADNTDYGLMVGERIQKKDLQQEMRDSYLAYAMSVIVDRALPDVRDGMKPVHRRVIYAMYDGGYRPDRGYSKCARVVGEVMGKYHPHGDFAIYDTLVRMAQSWSMRYTLVDGQGNFGSPGDDPAAAMRYTECRMAPLAMEMVRDIDKDTVDFLPNYDGKTQEPTVLPARFPNLLCNGSSGIAVGMATNIPPHNMREVAEGVHWALDHPDASREELLENLIRIIKGPDFPTGATILGHKGIEQAYRTGRGLITMRAVVNTEEIKGRMCLVITELPYQVNPDRLVVSIREAVRDGKIQGIADMRDETSGRTGQRLVLVLKRDAVPKVVLNNLYKYTSLQTTFGANNLALVNGIPKRLSLREMLQHYIDHQVDVVTRRTRFDLKKAQARAHILEGYLMALDHIDEVIGDTINRCVTEFCPVDSHDGERDLEGLHKWVVELTGRPDAPAFEDAPYNALCEQVLDFVKHMYDAKAERLGSDLMCELDRQVMLRVIDTRWMGYLQEMDYLKQGIGLRGFGQRDPLVEYKTEAFRAFRMLVDTMYEDYLRTVLRTEFKDPGAVRNRLEAEKAPALSGVRMSGPAEVDGDTGSSTIQQHAAQQAATAGAGHAPQGADGTAGSTVRTYRKDESGDPYANVGRNDPCPCGSGKKFKNCHGRNR